MGGAAGAVGGAVNKATKNPVVGAAVAPIVGPLGIPGAREGLFGGENQVGLLGTGQFKGDMYNANKDVFYNTPELQQRSEALKSLADQRAAMGNPTMAGTSIDRGPEAEMRNRQMSLVNALQGQMAGAGPTIAQSQLKQATDRNIQQAMAMAQSRGSNPAMARRQAILAASQAGQQAAAQSADLRAQEILAAQAQFGNLTGNMRNVDVDLGKSQAALDQAANANNLQAALEAQRQRDAMQQYYQGGMNQLTSDQVKSKQAYEALMAGQQQAMNQVNYQGFNSAQQANAGLSGGIISGLGSAIAMSDKNVKKNIKKQSFSEAGEIVKKMFAGGEVQGQVNAGNMTLTKTTTTDDESEDNFMKKWGDAATQFNKSSGVKEGDTAHQTLGKSLGALGGMGVSKMMYKGGPVCMDKGGKIPGKAQVAGDSPKNDRVPILASPGEVVVPRTAASDPDKLHEFVSALKGYKYDYKDSKHGEGEHTSVMAQDLEKSDIGRESIVETPEGKAVNYAKLVAPMLAHQSLMHEKIGALEAALKARKGGK